MVHHVEVSLLLLTLKHAEKHPTPDRPVRLHGGTSRLGRVEVFNDGRWGTVCDDTWNDMDAKVVCRQLGYGRGGPAQGVGMAYFGQGAGPILMDNVHCTGNESNLHSCTCTASHDCQHSEDAGVICCKLMK